MDKRAYLAIRMNECADGMIMQGADGWITHLIKQQYSDIAVIFDLIKKNLV